MYPNSPNEILIKPVSNGFLVRLPINNDEPTFYDPIANALSGLSKKIGKDPILSDIEDKIESDQKNTEALKLHPDKNMWVFPTLKEALDFIQYTFG